MSGVADYFTSEINDYIIMYQTALFVEPGQSPSHTLLSPFMVVTQEVLPSIVPLECGICAHFCECWWNGTEFN